MESNNVEYPLVKTFLMMFSVLAFIIRLHNQSGPYHYIKCYVTIKQRRIARLLMCDWLGGNLRVRYMYPEYLDRLSFFGLIGYILAGLGYLWVLWIIFIEKNPQKAYDYGIGVMGVVFLFTIIKRENADETIKHYHKLVKEGKIRLFGDKGDE